jgi:putative Ig domain-containing protein/calcineurin-like phosphoesterase family protein
MGSNASTGASLKKLDSSGVDFFMAVGDLKYGTEGGITSPAMWCDYVKSRLPTLGPNFPFELVAGNHEDEIIQQFADCLPDRLNSKIGPNSIYSGEYYFDYPPSSPLVRVLMISPALKIMGAPTYEYTKGKPHFNFVAGAIDDARAKGIPWTVVGMHIDGIHSPDLTNMLVEKKVDLIIQGHDHGYKRGKQLALKPGTCPTVSYSDPDCVVDDGTDRVFSKGRGTITLVNGSFGEGSPNGFTKFNMSADRIDAEFVNSTSSFTDTYSIVPNQPPIFTGIVDQDDAEDGAVSLPISASDPEGESVTYGATGLPTGLSINSTTGLVSGTIATGAREGSPYTTRVTAIDRDLFSSTAQFTWIVRDLTAPARPPSLSILRHTDGILLDWPNNTEADLAGYNIYRSPTETGTFTKLNDGLLTASEYFDAAAPVGATSYYKIQAVDRVGNESSAQLSSARRSKIVFVSSAKAKGSGMTMAMPKPPNVVSGDVLLAGLSVRGSVTIMPPKGWTLVSQISHTVSMSHQAIFRHTVAAADPSAYIFSFLGRSSAVGLTVAYRGAMQSPARSGAQANPASKSITAPSITPPLPDSVQVGFFGISSDAPISPPVGMMERGQHMLSSGPLRATLELADTVVAAQTLASCFATASKPAQNMGQVVILSPA